MSITFQKLLSDCLVAMGDPLSAAWSRLATILPWAEEAMLQFPILRPMEYFYAMLTETHTMILPSDFREVISVEYPVNHEPPEYHIRNNRFDPDFYSSDLFYDVDRDYASGTGWIMWFSRYMITDNEVRLNYLANHKIGLADDGVDVITVPDEYENIVVAYVLMKSFRERLGAYMQDPTAHTSIIQQMTHMVEAAEKNYYDLTKAALAKYTDSKVTPHFEVDKFDRVY